MFVLSESWKRRSRTNKPRGQEFVWRKRRQVHVVVFFLCWHKPTQIKGETSTLILWPRFYYNLNGPEEQKRESKRCVTVQILTVWTAYSLSLHNPFKKNLISFMGSHLLVFIMLLFVPEGRVGTYLTIFSFSFFCPFRLPLTWFFCFPSIVAYSHMKDEEDDFWWAASSQTAINHRNKTLWLFIFYYVYIYR